MIKILFVLFAVLNACKCQRVPPVYVSNGTRLNCIPGDTDASCTFSEISDPMELFQKLPDINNPRAAAVKKLKFYGCYIDYFMPQLFTTFPSLEEVDASSMYLIRLDRKDLPKNNVRRFNVSHNKIHRLPTDMLIGMPELESLDLSHNIIERILPKAFPNSHKLYSLNMSHNMIPTLDREFFDSVRAVVVLNLADNRITEITGNFDTFIGITKELYLQNNRIVSLDPQLVKSAEYLDISLNKLNELNLREARTLVLNIRANELKNLTIGRKLVKLDASENKYYQFKINCGSDNNNLTDLTLKYIKMSTRNEKLFIDFRKFDRLRNLDLSDNNLMEFDLQDIAYSRSLTLETLNLRNSHVRKIKNWNRIKFLLPNVREINVFDNIFPCDEMTNMITEFLKFNISLPEYDVDNNTTFFSRSCTYIPKDYTPTDAPALSESHAVLIWAFVSFFLIGFIITGIVYINKKLSLFEKIYDAVKINPHKPRGSKLLDEEKANDIENPY